MFSEIKTYLENYKEYKHVCDKTKCNKKHVYVYEIHEEKIRDKFINDIIDIADKEGGVSDFRDLYGCRIPDMLMGYTKDNGHKIRIGLQIGKPKSTHFFFIHCKENTIAVIDIANYYDSYTTQ